MRPVKGFGFFQMDRIIRTIALIDPAPLVHAAHIFSQAVHDILFVHFIYKGILTFPQIRGLIPHAVGLFRTASVSSGVPNTYLFIIKISFISL